MVATDMRETVGGAEPVLGDVTAAPPTPAARYAACSVASTVGDVVGARIRSRGLIRIGGLWWPFRSHEVTLPTHGYFREIRMAGGLRVVDSWVDGEARRSTTLLGRCLHPALVGPDLARTDVAHAALSAMWVPPVLLPSDTVRWTAEDRDSASVALVVAGAPVSLRLTLHRGGLPRRISTMRWGDPEGSGRFREVPFGAEILEHRTFGGLTVPSTGVLGWRLDGPGPGREVVRFQLTALEPVPGAAPLPSELADPPHLSEDSADGEP
ncbi:hypothetical protein GCM10023199_05120 [Actinomycetospora chibensis]